jgi:hypothetical protein
VITKRTVFVLGAGANVPYGFSTGGDLIEKVRGVDPRTLMGNAGNQITRRESAAFQAVVNDNLLPSIDALLEHRADLVKVGKRVMATVLYAQEAKAGPKSFAEDWMRLIFAFMAENASSLEAFARNPVSFVTFNYDRYLEHRFIRGLVARYGSDERAAWQAMSNMFVHLYGTLGKLPEQSSAGLNDPGVVPLGAPETEDTYNLGLALPIAEQAIVIVHQAAQPPQPFAEAGQRFQTAEQVQFLGFGFGKQNVERLGTDRIPAQVSIECTTYDMTNAEVLELVLPAFPAHDLQALRREGSTGTRSIRQFLRERVQRFR